MFNCIANNKGILFILLMIISALLLCACNRNEGKDETITVEVEVNNIEADMTLEEIMKLNNDQDIIEYSEETNSVCSINGEFTDKKIFSAEEAVSSLGSVRTIMNIKSFSYACQVKKLDDGNTLFTLRQLYDGVVVYGGLFEITVREDGTPIAISGKYVSDIDVDVNLHISEKDAKKLIKSGEIKKQELVVYKTELNDFRMAWYFEILDKNTKQLNGKLIDAANKCVIDTFAILGEDKSIGSSK